MGFIQGVLVENTHEAREYLEYIGYKLSDVYTDTEEILFTTRTGLYGTIRNSQFEIERYSSKEHVLEGRVNCIGNPSLFKAVAAMSNDSDYMQWFIEDYNVVSFYENGLEVILCENDIFPHEDYYDTTFHKATLEELIDNFKK